MRATTTRRQDRRRRARGLRRPLPTAVARRSSLVASGVVALLVGMATGVASQALAGPGTAAGESVSPASCASAQEAWSRAAAAQIAMSADNATSLRRGFVGARDALVDVAAPAPVADDWASVLAYLDTVADAIGAPEGDSDDDSGAKPDDDVVAAVGAALADLDTTAMAQESDRITRYLRADCAAG